jgi:hypothetical protein
MVNAGAQLELLDAIQSAQVGRPDQVLGYIPMA